MARDGSAMEDAFKPEAMVCGSNDQQQKSAVSSTTS
jgi:UDP-glucose 6-dehydrogenase